MSSTTMTSPLEPILGPIGDALPAAFRRQFLTPSVGGSPAVVRGAMEEIWHPNYLTPVFWLLSKGGILAPASQGAVPTVLTIIAERDADGRPFQRWNRTFDLPGGKQHHFDTKVVYDEALGCAADIVGAGDSLYLAWSLMFLPPDLIEIRREACAIRLFGRRVWLPKWLWFTVLGRETFRQWATSDDSIRIELAIDHPWFGRVFIYRGAFRVSAQL